MAKRPIPQAGVLAFRKQQLCLVTCKSGKRWVLPKGCLEKGKSLHEIAEQEAWEEAGIEGKISSRPIGTYHYRKSGQVYEVTVFIMSVKKVRSKWPERGDRVRRWVRPKKLSGWKLRPTLSRLLRQATDLGS